MTINNLEVNMANMALVPQQRLPIELVAHISSFLVDTSSLRSLAKIQQVSHAVQEETIKLNQTWVYKSVPAWLQTVGHGIPKGWAHARNLLLNDTTLALLNNHLGFLVQLKLIDKPLISKVFPKLELLAVTDTRGFTRLTIYKPMSLAGIMERLDINTYTERSFYGTIWNRKEATPLPRYLQLSSLFPNKEAITSIELQDGAYLLPSDDSDEAGTGCYIFPIFPDLCLNASGPVPKDREAVKAVISGMVQFLKCYQRAQERLPKADIRFLRFEIPAEWLELVVSAMEKRQMEKGQKLLSKVSVALSTPSTFVFTRLAEVYAANWSQQSTETAEIGQKLLFVSLMGSAVPDPGSSGMPVTAASRHTMFMAKLESGHLQEDANGNVVDVPGGFTSYITRLVPTAGRPPQVQILWYNVYAGHGA